MTIRKIGLRAINDIEPYTLAGAIGSTNHEKRLNIVKLLEGKGLAINTIPIAGNIASVVGLTNEETCTAPMKTAGIVLARAYIDGTEDTAEIKIGRPVAFDTVTGVAVTGVHDSWIQLEYRRIGLALDNFSKIQPYEGSENLVQIKIDLPEDPGDDIVAKTPPEGIPSRNGLHLFHKMCEIYKETEVGAEKDLTPIYEGGAHKKIKVFNIVNGPIGGGKIVGTSLTRSGTRYVNVESCLPES